MTQSNETSRQPKDEDSDLTRNESRLVNHRILTAKARRQKPLHPRRSFIPRTVFREAVFSVTYTQCGSFALISHLIIVEAKALVLSFFFIFFCLFLFFSFFFLSDVRNILAELSPGMALASRSIASAGL